MTQVQPDRPPAADALSEPFTPGVPSNPAELAGYPETLAGPGPVSREERFYRTLLMVLAEPGLRRGQWQLAELSSWPGDARYDNLVAWCWRGDSRIWSLRVWMIVCRSSV